jgi:lipoate-protein ligase B
MSTSEERRPQRPPTLRVRRLGRTEYGAALALQESILSAKIGGDLDDDLILLEHPPVYTLGRGADEAELLDAPRRLAVPVHRVGRGGGATFHGPGQLVSYPVVHLRPSGRDVHRYVRSLERVLIETCARLGLETEARAGQTGVWARGGKVGSIGIGVRRGVAFHGTSLNVDVDLAYFASIVVCRMPDARITSIRAEVGAAPDIDAVASVYADAFVAVMGYAPQRVLCCGREVGPTSRGERSGARATESVRY